QVAQNNDGNLYDTLYANFLHIALMGDPTLRMHQVAPPLALKITTNKLGQNLLSWNASGDSVVGYAVYGGPAATGPFTRLNSALVSSNSFIDLNPTSA